MGFEFKAIKNIAAGATLLGATAGAVEAKGLPAKPQESHASAPSAPVQNFSLEERQKMMRQEQEKMETIDEIGRAKSEIIEHLSSARYFKKLISEFGGNKKLASQEQNKRIENISTVKIVVTDQRNVEQQARRLSSNDPQSAGAVGIYSPKEHRFYVAYDSSERDEVIYHELLHSVTRAEEGISQRAKDILSAAYLKQGFAHILAAPHDKHFSKPSELLAGKMALERDLERLGIWKYGEKFTRQHYENMMDAFKKGKISRPGGDFIQVIKKHHLGFVLDKVAKTESESESVAA